MGLRKAGHRSHSLQSWALPLVLMALSLGLQMGGETVRDSLRYDRAGIENGELFRLLGGHLVHLGWAHLLLNLAGLALIWALLGDRLRTAEWLAVLLVSIVAIDIGLWLSLPGLIWYVGLSGVLHGMFAAGIPALWSSRRMEAALLALVLAAKLAYEGFVGPMPGSADSVGGSVITESHLFGAIGGLLVSVATIVSRQRKAL